MRRQLAAQARGFRAVLVQVSGNKAGEIDATKGMLSAFINGLGVLFSGH